MPVGGGRWCAVVDMDVDDDRANVHVARVYCLIRLEGCRALDKLTNIVLKVKTHSSSDITKWPTVDTNPDVVLVAVNVVESAMTSIDY